MRDQVWKRVEGGKGDNKYVLVKPLLHLTYEHPRRGGWLTFSGREIEVKPFANKWLTIIPADRSQGGLSIYMEVSEGYACDGASLAPDIESMMDAFFLHDPVYQFADAIAAAWGCSVAAVLRWGDAVMLEATRRRRAPKALRGIYYGFVRAFGWPYNRIRRWIRKHMGR